MLKMDTDDKRISESKLIELEKQLKEYYEKMSQLIKDKDTLTALIIEVEFQIFYKRYSF